MNEPCTDAIPAPGPLPPGADPLRHNRGNRSTIADLPPNVRAEICREIRAGTPDAAVAGGLRARGYAISRSAIYRFRKSAADSLAQWSAIRDAAALWSEGGTDAALAEMLRLAAFAAIARMDPADPGSADDTRAIARLARAIRDLAAAGADAKPPAAPRDPAPEPAPPDPRETARNAAMAKGKDNYYSVPQPYWTREDWLEYGRRKSEAEREYENEYEHENEDEPADAPELRPERECEPPPDGETAPPLAATPRKLPPCLAAAAPPIPANRPFDERRRHPLHRRRD